VIGHAYINTTSHDFSSVRVSLPYRCSVLVVSRNGFERELTIDLNYFEGLVK